VAVKEAPDRARGEVRAVLAPEHLRQLDQRDVHLGIDRTEDRGTIGLDPLRALVAALWLGPRRARRVEHPNPADGRGDADPEALSGRPARKPALHCPNDAAAKILR
jgi:hypothetical protein